MRLTILIFLQLSYVFVALGRKHRSLGGGCLLPKKPDNGDYEVTDCVEGDFSSKCRKVPDTIVSLYVVLVFWCDPGFVLSENNKHSICINGTWDPQPPLCQKLCKELSSTSVDLECTYLGKKVDCSQPVRPGTGLRTHCKDTYHISDPSTSFIVSECLSDGTWANELYKCVPDCGISNRFNGVSPLLKGDSLLNQSEYPWHAGLYITKGNHIVYRCGATIIHPKAVLTAASCVYNGTTKTKIDEKKILVAVGKYRSDWNATEATEQKFRVTKLIIGDKFVGQHNRYEHDIAILGLDRFITINAAAMPICFDRGERLSLFKGSKAVGTVVSWGGSETHGKVSDVLKVATFQVLSFDECHKKLKETIFITYDKFCAGFTQDIILQKGDIGNGLTFPRFDYGLEQHFIYGIFTLQLDERVIGFTNVTEHMPWIKNALREIEKST